MNLPTKHIPLISIITCYLCFYSWIIESFYFKQWYSVDISYFYKSGADIAIPVFLLFYLIPISIIIKGQFFTPKSFSLIIPITFLFTSLPLIYSTGISFLSLILIWQFLFKKRQEYDETPADLLKHFLTPLYLSQAPFILYFVIKDISKDNQFSALGTMVFVIACIVLTLKFLKKIQNQQVTLFRLQILTFSLSALYVLTIWIIAPVYFAIFGFQIYAPLY